MEKEYETKDTKSQIDELKSQQNDNGGSTQTTSIQNAKISSLTKKWKEVEERPVVRSVRDKTPSRRSKATGGQVVATTSVASQKARFFLIFFCVTFKAK